MIGLAIAKPKPLEAGLKIVFVTDLFQPEMGYATVRFPVAMAKVEGHEVHIVTAGMISPVQNMASDQYAAAIRKNSELSGKVIEFEGTKVHFLKLGVTKLLGMRMEGLGRKLAELKPDIVQIFVHTGWSAIDTAWYQRKLGYKLFTGNHTGYLAYPPAQMNLKPWSPMRIKEFVKRGLPGRLVSMRTSFSYGAIEDATDVAIQFFGVPKKIAKTMSLGVDTDIFHPNSNKDERDAAIRLRNELEVASDEIMCLFTGKLTNIKKVKLLANAVKELRHKNQKYRAVFFGDGPETDNLKKIEGAIVRSAISYKKLGNVYRAADIAVWPEGITTSTLDAAACGIPIIVNDQILANERYEGNGLTYRLGDIADLKRALLELKDPALRKKLGDEGARKMREEYSWDKLVQQRLDDYRAALANKR
jgi:glycosyltransferase involved in cell wall biosynthesis